MFMINYRDKQGVFERAHNLVIALAIVIAIVAISSVVVNNSTQAASPYDNGNRINSDSSQPVMSGRTDYDRPVVLNSTIVGYHDGSEGIVGFGNCDASGWAFNTADVGSDVTVQIFSSMDGLVATTVADVYRGDLTGDCPGGTCGFYAYLWGLVSPGVEHQITAQAYDSIGTSWIDLPSTPKTLTCWGYPEGVHDGNEGVVGFTDCESFGWAFDPDDYERDVEVRILSDGVPVVTTTADGYRGDINPVFCPEGTCGFSVSLWKLISPREEHQISAQVYDQESSSWINLDDAPKSLNCWGYELYLPALLGQH